MLNNLIQSLIISTIITFTAITISFLISPKQRTRKEGLIFECGFNSFSTIKNTFDFFAFKLALAFLIFDVEVAYLYFAVYITDLKLSNSIYLFIFVYLLLFTIVIEIESGFLDFKNYN